MSGQIPSAWPASDISGTAYTQRARIGLIVPPTNSVNEAEWRLLLPQGVGFCTTRMPLHPASHTTAGQAALAQDLAAAMDLLRPARVGVIAYACTAGSMQHPPEAMPNRMQELAGLPCITTAAAIIASLRRLGISRIAIATPYHDALNQHETAFLAQNGIATAAIAGLGIGAGGAAEYPLISQVKLADIAAHARAVLRRAEGAQALLISCTDFPSLPLIAALEQEFGIPVISSNTATLWAALRRVGVADTLPGSGRLFDCPELSP